VEKKGFTVWFTGLPFSGKKQLAGMLSARLESIGYKTKVLDSGKIRREYSQELGYSKAEVSRNIKRLCFECQMLTDNDVVAIAVTISPYKDLRDECRDRIKRYIEVFCDAPISVLKKRDTKGLYEKAEKGLIQDVAGISAPFEPPDKPEVFYQSDLESPQQGLFKLIATLEVLGYIEKQKRRVLTKEEEEMIRKRLKDLGYI
jgi:adenylylsulfate kinase